MVILKYQIFNQLFNSIQKAANLEEKLKIMNENEKAKADLESFESISLKKLNQNILKANKN